MPSASSSSSSSLYIIGASSPLCGDPIIEGSDAEDDGGGGTLSSSVAERFPSSFQTQGALDALCREYGVPEQYSAILPAAHQRACSPPPPGTICVYAPALEAGMRVPLHGFFCEVLAHFGVAPSQITPNGWRAMAGFVVLSHSAGVAPSLTVFRHFFTLCAFKLKGWYCFRGKDVAGALFKGMPLSIKGWKEAFFFLKSPAPWPCRVKWGELSKGSTAEPVLTKEEKSVAKKLLRVHGAAVDIMAYLSESNLAAAKITGSSAKPPPPPTSRTTSSASAKGMDPCVYDMMKNLRAAKAAQVSGVTVKGEPASDTPLSGRKRKVTEDADKDGPSRAEPSTPLGHAQGSPSGASPFPPGFSTHKSSKITRERDGTSDWESARQMLQSIVTPAMEQSLSAAKPSDVIASSYMTLLQAANYASFSLGYALELEEKLAVREREADALRQQLSQATAELAGAKKAAAEQLRSAREDAVREFQGSTEQVLRFAEHALAGYEKGMEDLKRAVLCRYPHLDPEQLVVPADGGGARMGLKKTRRPSVVEDKDLACEWVPSVVDDKDLQGLVDQGFLPCKESAKWKSAHQQAFPSEDTGETIAYVSFFERGLGLAASRFLLGLLYFYNIELANLTPNGIFHVALFVHMCEAFLGINPHFQLFRYFFRLTPHPNSINPNVCGGAGFQLRQSTKEQYFKYLLKNPDRKWQSQWFIIRDLASQLPARSGHKPAFSDKWNKSPNEEESIHIKELVDKIANLKEQGLTAAGIAWSFIKRRIQPLQERSVPGYLYKGPEDPSRLKKEDLTNGEILERVEKLLVGVKCEPKTPPECSAPSEHIALYHSPSPLPQHLTVNQTAESEIPAAQSISGSKRSVEEGRPQVQVP